MCTSYARHLSWITWIILWGSCILLVYTWAVGCCLVYQKHNYFIPCHGKYSGYSHNQYGMRMTHNGKGGCIIVKYTIALLCSFSNCLCFLWYGINRFRQALYVKAELHYNLIPINYSAVLVFAVSPGMGKVWGCRINRACPQHWVPIWEFKPN